MNKKAVFTQHRRIGIGLIEHKFGESMGAPHYHDTYEIYLQMEGERYITIENESRHLTKGDLVLIEPYMLHITEGRDSTFCRRYLMNLYVPLMKTILNNDELDIMLSKLHTFVVHLDEKKFSRVYHILNNIYIYFCRDDALSRKLMYAAAFELMDFMCSLNAPPLGNVDGNIETNAVSIALKYVHNNYSDNISLDFISNTVNMSKSNFCLIFRKAVGETFVSYLNHVRISHAHRMICETKYPIKVIAEKTGFISPSYMIAMFKKINGITPNELRKAHLMNVDILNE